MGLRCHLDWAPPLDSAEASAIAEGRHRVDLLLANFLCGNIPGSAADLEQQMRQEIAHLCASGGAVAYILNASLVERLHTAYRRTGEPMPRRLIREQLRRIGSEVRNSVVILHANIEHTAQSLAGIGHVRAAGRLVRFALEAMRYNQAEITDSIADLEELLVDLDSDE